MKKLAPLIWAGVLLAPVAAGTYVTLMKAEPRDNTLPGNRQPAESGTAGFPRLQIDRLEHDFGKSPLNSEGSCQFRIRNSGNARLYLSSPPSRFGRLHVELTSSRLEPNETSIALVRWLTAEKRETFDSKALIASNDPTQPRIEIRVRGIVEANFAADPPSLMVPPLPPHKQANVEALLYSHVWKDFKIASIRCTHPKVYCQVSPASPEDLAAHQAECGYRLTVTFPPGLPHGWFREQIVVEVDGQIPGAVASLSIPLEGRVLRPLAIYGENIEFTGTVNLGVVRLGESNTVRLMMKVRDQEPQLAVKKTVVDPEFLEVSVIRAGNGADSAGHYHLRIHVPKTAPVCDFTNTNGHGLGKLRLEFDHPRIQDLDLSLYLTVEPKPR